MIKILRDTLCLIWSCLYREILRHTQRLANPVWYRHSRQSLLRLRQRYPEKFQVSLYVFFLQRLSIQECPLHTFVFCRILVCFRMLLLAWVTVRTECLRGDFCKNYFSILHLMR